MRQGPARGPLGAPLLAALVVACLGLVPAASALAVSADPLRPLDLGGVPAVGLLRSGRVLVLRPHRLEVVLDGRLLRTVPVRQPVDLAQLPSLVGDPAYAAPLDDGRIDGAGAGVRLSAVLAQRPGTAVTATALHLRLADSGGAGPARLTGTRARLTLRDSRVDCEPGARSAPVAAGFRYLHGSNLVLEDVTMTGLGVGGRPALPAVRADGGSELGLRRLWLTAGGPGVEVRDPAWLGVDGLDGRGLGGGLLTVSGGTGARIRAVSSIDSAGPAVRLRGAAGATIDGVTSTGDAAALVAQDVDGVRAGRVRARGDGVVLGGRGIELTDPDVDAPVDAVRVAARAAVVVRGGSVRGRSDAVDADPAGRAVLYGVRTAGAVRGPVQVAAPADGDSTGPPARPWWDRPMRGAGAVALVVLVAGACLEATRGRRRGRDGEGAGRSGVAAQGDGTRAEPPDGDLVLDLGERRVH